MCVHKNNLLHISQQQIIGNLSPKLFIPNKTRSTRCELDWNDFAFLTPSFFKGAIFFDP